LDQDPFDRLAIQAQLTRHLAFPCPWRKRACTSVRRVNVMEYIRVGQRIEQILARIIDEQVTLRQMVQGVRS
jgi:hypothetical protein